MVRLGICWFIFLNMLLRCQVCIRYDRREAVRECRREMIVDKRWQIICYLLCCKLGQGFQPFFCLFGRLWSRYRTSNSIFCMFQYYISLMWHSFQNSLYVLLSYQMSGIGKVTCYFSLRLFFHIIEMYFFITSNCSWS